MREILNISKVLFDKWNDNGIKYCHWKSNEHLYEGLIGETDLDILVATDNKESAQRILIECGFLKFVPQYGSRYDLVDDWIGCDIGSGRLIHIHLHYKMITGHKGLKEYDLPWTETVLDSRRMHDEFPVYVIDPDLEIVILLSRICLKATTTRIIKSKMHKFALSKSDCAEFAYLNSHASREKTVSKVAPIFGNDAGKAVELAFSTEYDYEWFAKSRRIVRLHLKKYNRYCASVLFRRLFFNTVLKLRLGLKKLFGCNFITRKTLGNGAIIAFIGQDGAGKSTVSDEVQKWLNWKIDAKKYYLGSGEHYRSWQKTLRSRIKKRRGVIGVLNNILVVSDLKRIAKVTYKKVKAAEKYASKGGIAIFDRYPQNQFDGINDGPKIRLSLESRKVPVFLKRILLLYAKKEEKFIKKATAIRPELVFKMTLPPDESLRRKPEESLEKITQKHYIVENLRFENSKVVFIDATEVFSKEIRSIHLAIWDFISNRGHS